MATYLKTVQHNGTTHTDEDDATFFERRPNRAIRIRRATAEEVAIYAVTAPIDHQIPLCDFDPDEVLGMIVAHFAGKRELVSFVKFRRDVDPETLAEAECADSCDASVNANRLPFPSANLGDWEAAQ